MKHEHKEAETEYEEEKEQNEQDCQCGCENCDCNTEDVSLKEIAYHADDKIDALIHLLLKKKVITESEFEEEYNSLFEESDEEEQ